jgi:hypothetical protein
MKGAASEVLNKVAFYNSHGRSEPMSSEKIKEFQSHAELLGSDGLRGLIFFLFELCLIN